MDENIKNPYSQTNIRLGAMTERECEIANLKKIMYDIDQLAKSIDRLDINIDSRLLRVVESFIVKRYLGLLNLLGNDIENKLKQMFNETKLDSEKNDISGALEKLRNAIQETDHE